MKKEKYNGYSKAEINQMTQAQKYAVMDQLWEERGAIVQQIEVLLQDIAKTSRTRAVKRANFKILGRRANDTLSV